MEQIENSLQKHTPFVTNIYTMVMGEVDIETILDGIANLDFDVSAHISNRGGWQSPAYVGTPSKSLDWMQELNRKIPFIVKQIAQDEYNIQLEDYWDYWVNVNIKDNYNVSHFHPGTALSAVFYVNVPKSDNGDGKIVFDRPDALNVSIRPTPHNENTWEQWTVEPVNKNLVIFPGFLKHSVEPSNSLEERISIAYNFYQKRVGSND